MGEPGARANHNKPGTEGQELPMKYPEKSPSQKYVDGFTGSQVSFMHTIKS